MWKRIVLWVVLIVVFVTLYQFNNSGGAPRVPFDPQSTVFSVFVVALFLVLFAVFFWRARKTNNLSMAAVARLSEGRYLEALQGFEAVVKRAPKSPVALHNLGIAQLGLWRVPEAEQAFVRALKASRVTVDLRTLTLPSHALALALLGRTADAEARLSRCEEAGRGDS